MFPRKLASNFRFFDFCKKVYVGSRTGTEMNYGSDSGSAKAKIAVPVPVMAPVVRETMAIFLQINDLPFFVLRD